MTSAIRLRRLLAEDRPTIQGYDQDEFARRLHYDRPHEVSLELFKYVRLSTAELLERLTEKPTGCARARTRRAADTPSKRGCKIYADHAHKHARQIRAARKRSAEELSSSRYRSAASFRNASSSAAHGVDQRGDVARRRSIAARSRSEP